MSARHTVVRRGGDESISADRKRSTLHSSEDSGSRGQPTSIFASRLRKHDVAAVLAIFGIAFFVVAWSGNLTSGPHYVDESQIFFLNEQIETDGFGPVAEDHLHERFFLTKRLVPAYLVHKLALIAAFGANLVAWHAYTALLGAVTAALLYLAARAVKLTAIEAFGFSMVVVLGEQSVLWWRLIHGEGIGFLFTALALLFIPLAERSDSRRLFQLLFTASVVAASLSKESFILLMPALVIGKVAVDRYGRSGGWVSAVRENWVVIAVIATVCLAELATIKFYFEKTDFQYTGWKGFHAPRLVWATRDFFAVPFVVLIGFSWALAVFAAIRFRARPSLKDLEKLATVVALAAGVLVPQLLLYMSSGFTGQVADLSRYMVPGTLAVGLLAVAPTVWVRRRLSATHAGPKLTAVVAATIAIYVAWQADGAIEEALAHQAPAAQIAVLLDAIENCVQESETVVVVGGEMDDGSKPWRMIAILTRYLKLENVRCLPVTDNVLQAGYLFEYPRHGVYRRGPSAIEVAARETGAIAAVVLADKSAKLEEAFTAQERAWFDPAEWKRIENARGEVVYCRRR